MHESYKVLSAMIDERSGSGENAPVEMKQRRTRPLEELPYDQDFHPRSENLFNSKTVVLVVCYNRPDYLRQTLLSLLEAWPAATKANQRDVELVVSQDGFSATVSAAAEELMDEFEDKGFYTQHWQHPRSSKEQAKGRHDRYFKLCAHYLWALRAVFRDKNTRRVIIVEDDLQVAPDFFEYMAATATLLKKDKTLMAASAWNDLGQPQFVDDPRRLFRTDFFPGLGWMMEREVFEELEGKWPAAYWDDWLRAPEQRKGRQFISPEISRSRTFGKAGGASSGRTKVYRKFIATIKLNEEAVPFTRMDLTYLEEQPYKEKVAKMLEKAQPIQFYNLQRYSFKGVLAKIYYHDEKELTRFAKILGIFDDMKHGIQRGSYHGTIIVKQEGATIMLTPEPDPEDR